MTLIYIPSPLPNESAASLLLRASYNNGYRALPSFLNAYGFQVHSKSLNSMLADKKKFREIIQKLRIPESSVEIIPATYGPTKASQRIWHGKPISYNFFCADGTKLCPECVKDSGILKRDWLLKHVTCCTHHQIKLISKCGYCHHPISSNRKRVNACYKCQNVFCSYSLEIPPDEEIIANNWFLEQLSSDNLPLIKSIKVYLSVLEYTMFTFRKIIIDYSPITLTYLFFNEKLKLEDIFIKIIHANKSLGHPRILLVQFLSSVNYDIHSFASNFFKKYSFDHLKFEQINEDFTLTKRTTAILIGANRANLDEDHFSFLKNDYGFSAKKVNSFLLGTLSYHTKSMKKETDYLTLKEASKALGINYDLTTKLFSTDSLIQKKKIYRNNRAYTVLNSDELKKFDQKYITVNRLAKDLEVFTLYLTAKLISIGIEPIHGPFIDDVKLDIFRRKDIKHLTKDIVNSIRNHNRGFGHKTYMYNRDNDELKNIALKLKIPISHVKKLIKKQITRIIQAFSLSIFLHIK
ncbi:hypothetical protein E0H86_01030 [Acinetobacter sp. ANC 4635]|uniref:TniQ family protein n=1 Tax=Acinetobacter sp. ANC 4635 TaxID=2529846 RepID=UPI00103E5D3E|nr:TniQ family protein [Acinetobacter sp. ANC 4635]TCB33254.1 hypothetical protein E0H86_01030 [Acinetobacter sp. ANC 4635]